MTLSDWQKRLEAHFTRLQLERTRAIGAQPLFGLEHGLSETKLEDLSRGLCQDVAVREPSSAHWLVWVVHAAEIGYGYDGDEYWRTFDRRTPGWRFGDRGLIRTWFLKFHKSFGGARPVGAWAEHFNIICWPITHAILPLDLQQHLARILWALSAAFRAEHFESPELLGEQIAARRWNASPRFQNLAQEPLLLGQIATALLLPDKPMFKHLLLPSTLQRIARDLEKEAPAKRGLDEARRRAAGLHISGLRTHPRGPEGAPRGPSPPASTVAPELEPDLLLRPTPTNSWEVALELPNFSSITSRHPSLVSLLSDARCLVAGTSGRPLARGRVLSERQVVSLRRWPQPSEVMLRFEPTTDLLNALLAANCRLRPGPVWLFKIGVDGLGRWIRSRVVRPAMEYVILTTDRHELPEALGTEVAVECDGVFAYRLIVPAVLDAPASDQLGLLSLACGRQLDVRPVGPAPVSWDGEGRMECLSTDTLSLAIGLDHVPHSLAVSVNDSPLHSLSTSALRDDHLLYLQLANLPAGFHKLTFVLRPTSTATPESADLELLVREPRTWIPGDEGHRGTVLRIEADPVRPALEEIWEGRAAIAVVGPVGHSVATTIRLFERDGQAPILVRHLPLLPLPVAAEHFFQALEKQIHQDRSLEEAYDLARSCEVIFREDALGVITLRADRLYTPLRWIYGRTRTLRLVNDTGQLARVFLYAFGSPDKGVLLESDFTAQSTVPAAGGLYHAEAGRFSALLVVPPTVTSLADLLIHIRLDRHGSPKAQLGYFLAVFELWHAARATGEPRSAHIQRVILSAISVELVRTVCGATWADREREYDATGDIATLLSVLSDDAGIRQHLGEDLLARQTELAALSPSDLISPFAVALFGVMRFQSGPVVRDAHGVSRRLPPPRSEQPGWIAEFALRFASDPAGLRQWAKHDLEAGFEGLLKRPPIARSARLLRLALGCEGAARTPGVTGIWQW